MCNTYPLDAPHNQITQFGLQDSKPAVVQKSQTSHPDLTT